MLQYIILGLFILSLGICLIGNISVLFALIFGMFLFIFYSYKSGFNKKEILSMLMEGVLKIKNILIIFG
ncbi:MAG: sodium:proton antiporter, partial [Clostridium sp.]|nr:sodium:proton antiporter [Clostridium sp.]